MAIMTWVTCVAHSSRLMLYGLCCPVRTRGELEGLTDGKMWKVLVDFLVVDDFALELLQHCFLRDS